MKSTDNITKKVWTYSKSLGMLEAGDRILTGVSGGADSVCLLFLLHEIQKRIPIALRVVHVCHGIRKEAGEDADFVEGLCEKLEIPFERVDVDVPALAKREGLSEEEAGRKARYEIFEAKAKAWQREAETRPGMAESVKLAPESLESATESKETTAESKGLTTESMEPEAVCGRVKIALAHHAGDRAETLLFNLFRGSGLKGLASIPPMRETKVAGVTLIRPLLCLTREEIEEYLREKEIAYCQDATNAGDDYARNRIRHHVLPYAEQEICHGATIHINQAAELLAETEKYLKQQTDAARKECVRPNPARRETVRGDICKGQGDESNGELERDTEALWIARDSFAGFPALIQKRLLLELLLELSPGAKDIGAVHVEMVRKLFYGESGREADLPFGIHARREYESVILERALDSEAYGDGASEELNERVREISLSELSEKGTVTIPWGEGVFLFRILPYEKKERIPENTYTKWFDYDKIKNTLSIRTRRSGDYLMIRSGDERPVRKRLKEYYITEKFPRNYRETLPLLVEEGHVLWITGHRISEAYKVEECTKTILQVEWKRKWRTKDGRACQGTDF